MTRPIAEQEEQDRLREQGLKRCTKCKEVKSTSEFGPRPKNRDGLETWCRICRREWAKDKKEKVKEGTWDTAIAQRATERKSRPKLIDSRTKEDRSNFNKRHYYKYHDESVARAREYRLAHPDKHREAKRRWEHNNPEKKRAARQRYAAAHPDRVKQQALQTRLRRRAKDPIGVATQRANRYAKHRHAPGRYTKDQWLELLERCGNQCLACGSTERLTRDHIIPLDWPEGTNFLWNIQPLCLSCNATKQKRYAIDYRPRDIRIWSFIESFGGLDEER